MVKFIFGFILVFCLASCGFNERGSLPTIKISKEAIVNAKPFTEFLKNPSYVPLETVDSSIVSGNLAFQITPEYIWVMDKMSVKILAFDRRQGKFLRTIGSRGRGPNEYGYTVNSFYNLPVGKIYSQSYSGALMQYDVSGSLDKKMSIPFYNGSIHSPSLPSAYTCLNDTLFCAYYTNMNGLEKNRLVLFSPEGHVYKVFPNANIIKGIKGFSVFGRDGIFYSRNNSTYFKESASDTVFMVTMDTLQPHLLVDKGEYAISYAARYSDNPKASVTQRGLYESDRYFYFLFSFFAKPEMADSYLNGDYIAVYDKENKTQNVYKIRKSKESVGNMAFLGDNVKQELNFNPAGFYSGNLVASLSAMDIRAYFGDSVNPEQWKNVEEDDNPVLVFWKLP